MPVTHQFEGHYLHRFIPPRARKEREEILTKPVTVTYREVVDTDAPVVLIEHNIIYPKGGEGEKLATPYRWFDNQLWVECRRPPTPGGKLTSGYCLSEADLEETVKARGNGHIVINGQFWEPSGEPRYVVMTFGLGDNHGGTSISVDSYFNPNIHRSAYFPATMKNEAIVYALWTANNRDDDKSLERIRECANWIEVIDPSVVRVKRLATSGEDIGRYLSAEVARLPDDVIEGKLQRALGCNVDLYPKALDKLSKAVMKVAQEAIAAGVMQSNDPDPSYDALHAIDEAADTLHAVAAYLREQRPLVVES